MVTADSPDARAFWRPQARLDHLVITHVGEEVRIYDQTSHTIHHLNAASATVWRRCHGQRTLANQARESGMTEEAVQDALGKLADAGLLRDELASGLRRPGSSRRAF